MEEERIEKPDVLKKEKEKKAEEILKPCTTAASAEHARVHDDNEPCDDGRGG